MHGTIPFLIHHGYLILFLWVLAEQVGIAVPSLPILLAAGALAEQGKFSFALSLSLIVMAALIADNFWYQLGRQRGFKILRVLCRIAFEPDSCIRRTQNLFRSYGPEMLIFAKFVPGLGTVAVPLAGVSRMSRWRFLLLDLSGSITWAGFFLGLGAVFSKQLDRLASYGMGLGALLGALFIVLLGAYLFWKLYRRRRFMRQLRMARITPEELKQDVDAGRSVMIIDLRHKMEIQRDPEMIPGALHLDPAEVAAIREKLPEGAEVVLYCSCPNEVSSAHAALLLRRQGVTRVRPLAEGLDGWRKRGFPVAEWTEPGALGEIASEAANA